MTIGVGADGKVGSIATLPTLLRYTQPCTASCVSKFQAACRGIQT
jgi:hypothetical protein